MDAKMREVVLAEVLDDRPDVRWEDVAGLANAKQVRGGGGLICPPVPLLGLIVVKGRRQWHSQAPQFTGTYSSRLLRLQNEDQCRWSTDSVSDSSTRNLCPLESRVETRRQVISDMECAANVSLLEIKSPGGHIMSLLYFATTCCAITTNTACFAHIVVYDAACTE